MYNTILLSFKNYISNILFYSYFLAGICNTIFCWFEIDPRETKLRLKTYTK